MMRIRANIIGYLASVIVAGLLLDFLFFHIMAAFSTTQYALSDAIYVFGLMTVWALVLTVLPASILIYLAERFSWRSIFVYLIAGALMALPTWLWFDVSTGLECSAIGAVAGLTYWAITGRKAGLSMRPAA